VESSCQVAPAGQALRKKFFAARAKIERLPRRWGLILKIENHPQLFDDPATVFETTAARGTSPKLTAVSGGK
jgi:hypothetical protein